VNLGTAIKKCLYFHFGSYTFTRIVLSKSDTAFQFFSSNGLLSVLKLFSFCVACDTKRSHLFSSSHHTYFFIPLFSILSLPTTFSLKCCIPWEAFRYLAMLGSSLCLMRISTSFISPKSCEVNTNSKWMKWVEIQGLPVSFLQPEGEDFHKITEYSYRCHLLHGQRRETSVCAALGGSERILKRGIKK